MLGPRGRRWLNKQLGLDSVFLDFDADSAADLRAARASRPRRRRGPREELAELRNRARPCRYASIASRFVEQLLEPRTGSRRRYPRTRRGRSRASSEVIAIVVTGTTSPSSGTSAVDGMKYHSADSSSESSSSNTQPRSVIRSSNPSRTAASSMSSDSPSRTVSGIHREFWPPAASCGEPASPGTARHLAQRLVEIADEILGSLQPHRDSHHPVTEPDRGATLRTHRPVRGGGRMRDQRLGVAEVVGDVDDPQLVEHLERSLLGCHP